MGNLAAYNTSTFSGSFDRGNINIAISSSVVSGSTGNTRFGQSPTPPSGGMVIISDSNTQLGIASASATPQFWIIDNLNDTASVLNTINALPERINQTRFVTTSSAYLYLVSSSKYFPILGTEPLNTPVTDGLVMYLDANQLVSYPTTSSTWYDVSGNNVSGSLINGPTYNNGTIILDGIDDYIYQNFNTSLYYTNNQSWTIDALVNVVSSQSAGNTRGGILVNQRYQSEPDPGGFGLNIINQTYCINLTSGSTGNATSYQGLSAIAINYNKVERITAVWDSSSSTAKMYRNGVFITSTSNSTYKWSPRSVNINQTIGTSTQGGWTYYFPMKLYNMALYNKALSDPEILQNYYQAPIVTDGLVFAADAGNVVSYESGSTTTYSLTGSFSGSLINGTGYNSNNGGGWVFDGIDDTVSFGNILNLGTNDMTINCWFKINPSATYINYLVSKAFYGGQNYRYGFYIWNNQIGGFMQGNGGPDVERRSTSTLSVDTWYMGTIVFNRASSYKIYINDVEQTLNGDSTISQWNGLNFQSNNPFRIGSYTYSDNTSPNLIFNGTISNTQLYFRALNITEIQQNFNAQRQRFGI